MSGRRKGYLKEKRGTPEDAPPPIKIIGCRIIGKLYEKRAAGHHAAAVFTDL